MSGKRILVVDDDRELVKAIQIRLGTSGYEILTAYDGEEGLKTTKEHKPDLIVLDILLPKMQGDAVAMALKGDEGTRNIPIIFLTCLADGVIQGGEIIAGNIFLAKPFDGKELLLLVDKALKNKQG
jgi:DNA-binding response OmpR family regulator